MNTKWMLAPVLCCLALSACQKTPDTTGSLTAINTQKTPLKSAPQYYAVPAYHGKRLAGAPASTLPPGQNLTPLKHSRRHLFGASQKPIPAPVIKASMSVAWARVESALAKTPYKVMDKDSSLHVFYVLDRSRTKGHLTRKTPMYRIQLVQEKTGVTVEASTSDQADLPVSVHNALIHTLSKHL